MAVFLKNTTFHGILLDALFSAGGEDAEKAAVVRCMDEGLASGAVRPLPATVYPDHELEPAFRFMATGKHIGKVLLRVREEEAAAAPPAAPRLRPALPRTYMHPAKTYVLVAFAVHLMCAIGIGAGSHRLWTHRCFKAKTPLRTLLMLWQTMGFQILEEPGPENTRYDNLTPAVVKPATTRDADLQNLDNYDPFTMEIPYEITL